MQSFMERGLTPINVSVNEKGKQSQAMVFPWAIVTYKGKSTKVPLLKTYGCFYRREVNSSVQHLEYALQMLLTLL